MSKHFLSFCYQISVIKLWAPYWGVFGGVAAKNFGRQNCVCSLATLHKNLILMCCGLGEEHIRFKKEKKEYIYIMSQKKCVPKNVHR